MVKIIFSLLCLSNRAEMIKQLKVSRSRINQLLMPLIRNGVVMKEGLSKATRYRLSSR